jgi:hypothetical protein
MLGAVLEQLTNGPKAKNLKVSIQQKPFFSYYGKYEIFYFTFKSYLLGPSFNVLLDYLQ